jgi:branched-chain amino acid transport system substrate-binding protein
LATLLTISACGSRRDAQEFVAANSLTATGDVVPGEGPGSAPTAAAATVDTGALPAVPGSPNKSAGTAGTAGSTPTTSVGGAKSATGTGTGGPGAAPAGTADKCAVSGSTVTLGNVSTQSGLLGELFKGLPEGLQVWAKSANACGGLDGHPVRVISADDGADPATALTLAKRMVEKDKVIAFIGLENPLSIGGMQGYLKQAGVPSIGGDSSEPEYFTNPLFFPLGPFLDVVGAATADLAIKHGAKKIAVYYCAEVPRSCGPDAAVKHLQVGSAVVKSLGGEVLISQKASVAAPSFTSQCLGAKRAGVDAIVAVLDGASVGRLAENCAAQDYKPLYVGISLGLSENLVNYAAVNNNFVAPLQSFPGVDTSLPATRKYSADMLKYFGRLLGGPSPAMGYASGMLAAEAARAGLPTSPTAADMVKAMYTIKNDNLGGLSVPLTFTPKLPRDGVTSCYFMTAIVDGAYAAPQKATCIRIAVRTEL